MDEPHIDENKNFIHKTGNIYIFKHNGSKNRSIHFFHEILRVDDQRPKTPLVLNMKMYIKLVHNPGRDDCTCMSFKIKEKEVKGPKQRALP